MEYLGRWNTGESEDDHQLFQYLRLRIDNIIPNKVSLHFLGRLSAELDGRDDSDDFFHDIYDTFDHDVNDRVYYLYVDIKDPFARDSKLRLGRQYSYEAESVLFTGGKYEQRIDRLRFYVQGGVRGSHYTSPEKDDFIAGAGGEYQLFPYTIIGYDYLRAEEDSLGDDHHSFDIYQRIGPVRAYAQFGVLNNEADELNLYGNYYQAPLDLNLTARYYTLLNERERLSNEFSPLIDINGFDTEDERTLGVYFPFHLVNLSAYKGWGEKFATSGGFETRWMDDSDEENDFNREYDRFFVTLEVFDCLVKGLTTAFTFEYWNVDAGEDSIAFAVDAEKNLTDKLYAAVGFYYSRYRIRSVFNDTTLSEEIETPELYAKLKYKLKENVELIAKYEVEDESDLETTHELQLGCSIGF